MNLRVSGFKNEDKIPPVSMRTMSEKTDVKASEEELRKESWLPLTMWNGETYLNFKELFSYKLINFWKRAKLLQLCSPNKKGTD